MYFGRVQKILVVLVVKFVWGAGLLQELTNYMMLSGLKVLKKKKPTHMDIRKTNQPLEMCR